jgi:hypothetical protein
LFGEDRLQPTQDDAVSGRRQPGLSAAREGGARQLLEGERRGRATVSGSARALAAGGDQENPGEARGDASGKQRSERAYGHVARVVSALAENYRG